MKMLVLIAAMIALPTLSAAEQAFVYPRAGADAELIEADGMLYTLHITAKCKLTIANASNLRQADIYNRSKPDVGCWGKTLNPGGAEAIVIGPHGNIETLTLLNLKRVELLRTGGAKVIGPALSMDEYTDNVRKYHDSLR